MDREIRDEFTLLRSGMDQKFTELRSDMDQKFTEIRSDMDQKFTEIRSDMDQKFSKLSRDFHHKSLADEDRHATLLKMFDTIMHKFEPVHEFAGVKAQVERHETRTSALESAVRKS